MLSLIQFLEELQQNHQTITISPGELDSLVQRFGSQVRQIGTWNKATDGSLEVPMNNITAASQMLGDRQLTEALLQLKRPEQFKNLLNSSSAAVQLVDALAQLHLSQFEANVLRFQDSNDPTEADRLRQEISKELFSKEQLSLGTTL